MVAMDGFDNTIDMLIHITERGMTCIIEMWMKVRMNFECGLQKYNTPTLKWAE